MIDKSEFLNENAAIMHKRINSQHAVYLDSKTTFSTYFHINTKRSSTDTGTKNTEGLINYDSPVRYNEIKEMPLMGLEQMRMDLQDGDYGLSVDYEGTCTLLPGLIAPLPDDFFIIDYLDKKYLFRVTKVNYDNIKSNSFYEIGFELKSTRPLEIEELEHLVVEHYTCIYENIGTDDKAIVSNDDYSTFLKLKNMIYTIQDDYLNKFLNKHYNALMFLRDGTKYLYDPMVNVFCNKVRLFDKGVNSTDSFILYEEKKILFGVDYEDTIFDRVEHKDLSDIDMIGSFYDMEPAVSTNSIFDYYRDERVKYVRNYNTPIGPFANRLDLYLSEEFVTALKDQSPVTLENRHVEMFIYQYMINSNIIALEKYLKNIPVRRMRYTFQNYVLTPLLLYCLKQLVNEIMRDKTVMLEDSAIKENV